MLRLQRKPLIEEDIVSHDGLPADEEENPEEAAAKRGKVFLPKLRTGRKFFLKEIKAPDGYILPGGGWTIEVSKDEKVTITGQNNYSATYELPEEGESAGCYRISNVKVINLPSTGGPGDYLFTIIGIAISSDVILLKLRNRKKEIGL